MTVLSPRLLLAMAIAAIVASFSGLGLAIAALENSTTASHHAATAATAAADVSTGIRELLLNGKTASAKDAKRSAHELSLLIAQQRFDHRQTVKGQHTLTKVELQVENAIVSRVEASVDSTIYYAVHQEAMRFEAKAEK